jgi:DNA repair photolyase
VVQTRAALIERDLAQWEALAAVTDVRVSFSITTNREEVRRWYEPLTDPLEARLRVMERLRGAGLRVYATLAPLLPCDPEELASIALAATSENVIGDPFHNRCLKQRGATTDARALRISAVRGLAEWHSPEFQLEVVERIRRVARKAGRDFGIGPEGFKWLAQA